MLTSSPPTSAPGTDKTGMDFRRILPEIRCQSCLSPGSEPTPHGGFSTLLGWAFGPRNFMKNTGSLRRFPDVRGGFSPLLGWTFGPRNFMKNAVSLRRFPDVRGGFSTLSTRCGRRQAMQSDRLSHLPTYLPPESRTNPATSGPERVLDRPVPVAARPLRAAWPVVAAAGRTP